MLAMSNVETKGSRPLLQNWADVESASMMISNFLASSVRSGDCHAQHQERFGEHDDGKQTSLRLDECLNKATKSWRLFLGKYLWRTMTFRVSSKGWGFNGFAVRGFGFILIPVGPICHQPGESVQLDPRRRLSTVVSVQRSRQRWCGLVSFFSTAIFKSHEQARVVMSWICVAKQVLQSCYRSNQQ